MTLAIGDGGNDVAMIQVRVRVRVKDSPTPTPTPNPNLIPNQVTRAMEARRLPEASVGLEGGVRPVRQPLRGLEAAVAQTLGKGEP